MLKKTRSKIAETRYTTVIFAVFLLFLGAIYGTKSDRYFGWTNLKAKEAEPILSDGSGYYSYLPQWFIYKTSNFEFLDTIAKTYQKSRFADNVSVASERGKTNKYYTGTAVSLIPFFAVAHAYTKIDKDLGRYDFPSDGYSKPYLFMANVASIFYFLVGCVGIYLLLRRFKIQRIWIYFILFGIAFGTNVSYYSNVLTPFSHVFSFAIVAWLIYYAKKWADEHTLKDFVILCLFIGWAAIIRPTNILALAFVPFLFASTRLFFERIKCLFSIHWKHLLLGLGVFGLFLGFQLWSTYDQTGEIALNTYTTESFEFLGSPKFMDVWFSWRKGLFIFTPILFLMIPGWIILYRKERRLFWGSIVFFLLFSYITASWWCWWYGGGLGMRPFIDVLAILFIPIAFLLNYSNALFKVLIIGFILLTSKMYQVYEFQMKNNILHYDDMTYEQFKHVFMKDDLRYGWCLHLYYEDLPNRPIEQRIPRQFNSSGKPMTNNYYKLLGDNYGDNPVLIIKSDSANFNKRFGAIINAQLFLYSGDTNPDFVVNYYKGDTMFRENKFFIGQFIDHEGVLSPIKLELYPGLTYAEFDSVRIQFNEGNTFTGIKSLKLDQLVLPD